MFCPQCGLESQAELKFCRSCGANLKVIGKAVTLSEAIARSDGLPAKIKEMVQNLKVERVTEEVSRAMEKMNQEIARSTSAPRHKPRRRKEKTAAERCESLLTRGLIKLGWGSGFSIFLYFFLNSIVLKLNPDIINKVPFQIESVVHVAWLIGLIPVMSGLGHIVAGLTIKSKPEPVKEIEFSEDPPLRIDAPPPEPVLSVPGLREAPASVTDRTTNILNRDQTIRKGVVG
jgi:hypothetical protein